MGDFGTCVYYLFEVKNLIFFRACSQVILYRFLNRNFDLGLPNRGSRMGGIAKINFSWKSFLMNSGIVFCCFLEALRAASLVFLSLGNRLENEVIFRDITDPEALNWRG